jgi:hypothetical protein
MYFVSLEYYHCLNNQLKRTGFIEIKNKCGLSYPIGIHSFSESYHKTNWLWCNDYIKQIILPKDALISERYNGFNNHLQETNKIILGETYKLYDIRTIKKFNIYIDETFIAYASLRGHVNILEWWLNNNSNSELKYDNTAIDEASAKGQLKVLEWWKNSGLSLKYTERALDGASLNGYINVLDWWKNSGLPLKYTSGAFDNTIHNSKKNMATHEWWITSGLKVKSDSVKKYYIKNDKNWEKVFV